MHTVVRGFWARGAAAVLTGVALVWTSGALAGAGTTATVLTPLSANVTYDEVLRPTQLGYEVRISNAGGNTINAVRFIADLSATLGQVQRDEAATVEGLPASACVLTATHVECQLGQLQAGESAPVFAIFFRAPQVPASGAGAPDQAVLAGITYFAEQTNGGPNSPPNSSEVWAPSRVQLGTSSADTIRSALPRGGGTFDTAAGADPIFTAIKAPGGFAVALAGGGFTTYSSAEIREQALTLQTDPNCSNFIVCYQSSITIPGATFTPYLSITLRVAAANIKRGTKIASVLIDYVADDGTVYPAIGDCASPTTPNSNGVPCIAERKQYKNNTGTPALDGAFEWLLLNRGNGSYKLI